MIWFLYAPLQILMMIFCWLTNWFVCLFANDDGELPHIFRMWQTWDDSLNPRFHVKEVAPKFLQYDWDKHYIEYKVSTCKLEAVGQKRWVTKCIDNNFTLKERLQRYVCRVMWISRNCAYGFAFWCFGNTVNTAGVKEKVIMQSKNHSLTLGWDTSKGIFTRPWWIKSDRKISKHLEWNTYLGWKWWNSGTEKKRCMVANRVAVRISKDS